MVKKLLITNKANLKTKYGQNFNILEQLFQDIVQSDNVKGIDSTVVYLDDLATAQKYKYKLPVQWDEKACKDILDHIYWNEVPEYLTIFGAQDVFPFQNLINMLYTDGKDKDEFIPSDLPYASDSPYSTDCNAFTNPTRVVGRIPDLPYQGSEGQGDIEYVKEVIQHITTASPADPEDCSDYFCVSADEWKLSTQQSIRTVFGNSFAMKLSPPQLAGSYSASDLAALPHFFNLHGALGRRGFYGQRGSSYPEAINTGDLPPIKAGTFAAAECCYGAQLLPGPGISMASTYLKHKATVFMGSSTISYGPVSGQGLADLICQYFHKNVLKGASNGRALLDARQKFLSVNGPVLDAYMLKTLAQFYILGDSSLQAVKSQETEGTVTTIEDRRFNLMAKGMNLGLTIPVSKKIESFADLESKENFTDLLKELDFNEFDSKMVFEVDDNVTESFKFAKRYSRLRPAIGKVRLHVYQKGEVDHEGICRIEALVIKAIGDKMMGYNQYVSK